LVWSYAKVGIDPKKIKASHSAIAKVIQSTYKLRRGKFGDVLVGFGHYASLVDIGGGKALALHSDGCGTKVLVAQLMNRFNTIGIDCVAMCVNDIICIGAEPTTLIDYLALERPDETMVHEIMKGLAEAAEKTRISIIGGETAIMPDVIKGAVPGRGFDLSAFCLGLIKKSHLIMGNKLKPGDSIIGVESSGLHSNGFSLARKVLLEEAKYNLRKKPPDLQRSLGEELLEPTRIYLETVRSAIKNAEVHAIAHITGGAFSKLRRFEPYANVGFRLANMPRPQPIFQLIQKMGRINDEEMYRTFNMGIGLCIVTPKSDVEQLISACQTSGFRAYDIGKVTKELGVRLEVGGRTITL